MHGSWLLRGVRISYRISYYERTHWKEGGANKIEKQDWNQE